MKKFVKVAMRLHHNTEGQLFAVHVETSILYQCKIQSFMKMKNSYLWFIYSNTSTAITYQVIYVLPCQPTKHYQVK